MSKWKEYTVVPIKHTAAALVFDKYSKVAKRIVVGIDDTDLRNSLGLMDTEDAIYVPWQNVSSNQCLIQVKIIVDRYIAGEFR